jgi:hypothetical protein
LSSKDNVIIKLVKSFCANTDKTWLDRIERRFGWRDREIDIQIRKHIDTSTEKERETERDVPSINMKDVQRKSTRDTKKSTEKENKENAKIERERVKLDTKRC